MSQTPAKRTQEELFLSRQLDLEKSKVCSKWAENIKCVLFSEDQIRQRVKELGEQISRDYEGKEVICLGLLTGAFVFVADLVKNLTVPYLVDFMVVSSYGGKNTESTGSVKVKKDLSFDPAGKHILIIEDLIDTGGTLMWIQEHIKSKKCASCKFVTLLNKSERRKEENKIAIDYVGFDCPNEFVVGYGMDFNDEYRGMPFVGVLKPEAYM